MKSISALVFAMSAAWFTGSCLAQGPCPNPPPAVVTNPQPPADVCLPPNVPGVPIQFFDDFSWRSFVALVWPAQQDHRGVPDAGKPVGGDGFRVFETYKQLAEVFHNDGS